MSRSIGHACRSAKHTCREFQSRQAQRPNHPDQRFCKSSSRSEIPVRAQGAPKHAEAPLVSRQRMVATPTSASANVGMRHVHISSPLARVNGGRAAWLCGNVDVGQEGVEMLTCTEVCMHLLEQHLRVLCKHREWRVKRTCGPQAMSQNCYRKICSASASANTFFVK